MLLFRSGGREAEGFDAAAEGAKHGLAAADALALWTQIRAEAEPTVARRIFERRAREQAKRRPGVGKRTRVAAVSGPLAFDDYRVLGVRDVLRAVDDPALRDEVIASAAHPIGPRAARWQLPARDATPRGHALAAAAERRAVTLYRRAIRDAANIADPAVAQALAARGEGAALPAELQRAAEAELGVSLAGVRVHVDELAARAAEAVGAAAFTVGEDVFFAAGAFAPDTDAGRSLVAHELAHVAQALRGQAEVAGLRASRPDEALEREADALAARITRRPLLERMGRLFGADFSGVRLHEHSGGARAVTRGADVHFAGAIEPHVLAHELAHVVQATAHGPAAPRAALEVEAHRAADLVAEGRAAPIRLAAAAGAAYAYTDAHGNQLPDPVDVTWNADAFHLEFRKDETQSSPRFMCKLTYTGDHPVDGVGINGATKIADFGVMVTAGPLHATIVRNAANTLDIDLLGDSHQMIRIADVTTVKPGQGRGHDITMSLNRGSSGSAVFTVRDPAAKASDVRPSAPDERPGTTPFPLGTPSGEWNVELDADGDQYPDLAVKLESTPKTGPAKRVRLTLTQLATKTQLVRDLTMPPAPAGSGPTSGLLGQLMPIVKQLNDGGRATILTLTTAVDGATPELTIEPPTRTQGATTYRVKGPGLDEALAFPASTPHDVFGAGTASVDGGIVNVDLTLGAYKDKFRITIQPRTPTSAIFGISQLSFHGEAAGAQSATLTIAKPIVFRQLLTGATSFGLDLDGDQRPDLMLYDQLTSATVGSNATPEADRDHTIRVVGEAIGGEASFKFRVRSGSPMWDGSTVGTDHAAGSNAVAIDGLKDQKAEGTDLAQRLATYELAMIAERAKAVPAIIKAPTFSAWAALSESMIKLRSQHPPDPQLLPVAASQATAFFTALAADTASADSTTGNHWSSTTKNRYTDSERKDSAPAHGAGPDLAGDILAGNIPVAVAHYQRLVAGLDQWIVDQTVAKQSGPDVDRLRLIAGKRRELGELDGLGAQPVIAVFQPDAKFKNEQGYVSQVPLSLYYWKEGSTWHLRNISNPEHVYSVTADAGADEAASLRTLLGKLDDPDRMPAGLIHYEIPGKTAGEVKTTDGMTWKKALTYLGLALAAVGFTLATFGTGAVEVAGVIATAGAGLASGAAAAIDLVDKHAHGDLYAKTAVLDLAQVVSGLAGASAVASGRITVAAANAPAGARWAGNWARVAVLSSKIYLPATRVAAAADALTFAVVTPEMASQLDKVDANGKLRLLVQWAGMAALTALQVKGAAPKAGTTKTLVLSPGPDGRPVATLALDAGSTIIDSQISIALDKQAKGLPMSPLEKTMAARAKAMTDMRVTDTSVGELSGDLGSRGTPISVDRSSKEYQDMIAALEGTPPVGRAKGAKDRRIVADAFFGITEPGAKPTLATGDAGIFNPLAQRSGIQTSKLGSQTLPEKLASPEGCPQILPDGTKRVLRGDRFDVEVNGRTITVIPIR